MPLDGISAIRSGVALCEPRHVGFLRLAGEDAFALLDRVVPAELHLRDAMLLQTVLLDEEAHPIADLYVGRDDEEFLLVSEGLDAAGLASLLERHAGGARVTCTPLEPARRAFQVDGPYAWELMSELVGPEIVGLPYANLFHVGDWLCMRAGKTGEYGYTLLVPHGEAEATRARLSELGKKYEMGSSTVDDLDQCALENWFFNIRREGRAGVTPIELQLQWRVSYRKQFVGAAALARRRAEGIRRRLTCLVGPGPMRAGEAILRDGANVGELVNCGFSSVRGDWVGLALVDLAVAHPGLDGFALDGGAPLRTVAPPVLNNRSLYVSPQRHAFATRSGDNFPPLF
jgi:aminomethyltransferase